ncbi:hypothetical protein A3Q56_03469, partial [Intoshia linei]
MKFEITYILLICYAYCEINIEKTIKSAGYTKTATIYKVVNIFALKIGENIDIVKFEKSVLVVKSQYPQNGSKPILYKKDEYLIFSSSTEEKYVLVVKYANGFVDYFETKYENILETVNHNKIIKKGEKFQKIKNFRGVNDKLLHSKAFNFENIISYFFLNIKWKVKNQREIYISDTSYTKFKNIKFPINIQAKCKIYTIIHPFISIVIISFGCINYISYDNGDIFQPFEIHDKLICLKSFTNYNEQNLIYEFSIVRESIPFNENSIVYVNFGTDKWVKPFDEPTLKTIVINNENMWINSFVNSTRFTLFTIFNYNNMWLSFDGGHSWHIVKIFKKLPIEKGFLFYNLDNKLHLTLIFPNLTYYMAKTNAVIKDCKESLKDYKTVGNGLIVYQSNYTVNKSPLCLQNYKVLKARRNFLVQCRFTDFVCAHNYQRNKKNKMCESDTHINEMHLFCFENNTILIDTRGYEHIYNDDYYYLYCFNINTKIEATQNDISCDKMKNIFKKLFNPSSNK